MNSYTIPPLNHPLAKEWAKEQPHPEMIRIGDDRALMDKPTFDRLKEYSNSVPTGVFPGKMWKRHEGSLWLLCWFEESQTEECKCYIRHREILIQPWSVVG